jgi:hypothetical protein
MYQDQQLNVPSEQAGYQPYFYHAGLFARYLVPAVNARPQRHERTESTYDFSSDYPAGPRFDRFQTVEQVIAHGYFSVPYANPITAIISDKMHVSRLGLDDVIRQVRSRYEIYQNNIYELNQAVCEVNNGLFRQLADHGTLVANQRQMYSVTKQVQKLYEQQREERINLWRDVSRLKLGLPETAQEYLAAYRKVALLKENEGDAQ